LPEPKKTSGYSEGAVRRKEGTMLRGATRGERVTGTTSRGGSGGVSGPADSGKKTGGPVCKVAEGRGKQGDKASKK